MSTTDTTAAPKGPVWEERAAREAKRRSADHDRLDRYPAEEPNKPPPPAGYGNTRPAGIDLQKLRRLEVDAVAARGKARALDEAAADHRSDARNHAAAAFRHSVWVPASENYRRADIEPFLTDPKWPLKRLDAERISAADLRQAVFHYELADAFELAAKAASKEAADLRQLVDRLQQHAFPRVTGLVHNAGPRLAV